MHECNSRRIVISWQSPHCWCLSSDTKSFFHLPKYSLRGGLTSGIIFRLCGLPYIYSSCIGTYLSYSRVSMQLPPDTLMNNNEFELCGMAAVEWRRGVNLEGNGLVSGLLCRKTSVALQPGFYITWLTRSTADWDVQFHPGKPEVEAEVGGDDHAQWHCGLQPWPWWHVLPQLPWLDPHLHQQKCIYCGACKCRTLLICFYHGRTHKICWKSTIISVGPLSHGGSVQMSVNQAAIAPCEKLGQRISLFPVEYPNLQSNIWNDALICPTLHLRPWQRFLLCITFVTLRRTFHTPSL